MLDVSLGHTCALTQFPQQFTVLDYLLYGATRNDTAWHGATRNDLTRRDTKRHGVARSDTKRLDTARDEINTEYQGV